MICEMCRNPIMGDETCRICGYKPRTISFMRQINARYNIMANYGIKKEYGWFYLVNEYWGDSPENKQQVSDPKKFPFKIVAKLKSGQKIGYALVDHTHNKCFIHEVEVMSRFRRKGVATAMYDFAEELTGKKCIPSSEAYDGDDEDHLSEQAKKFWNKRRGGVVA